MTTVQVAKWLQQQDEELNGRVSAGCIDTKKDRCVGVYDNPRASRSAGVCISGEGCTPVLEKDVTLLVHWGKLPGSAEEKAMELYERMQKQECVTIGGAPVSFISPGKGPVATGRDEHGVYEYVINAKIYYERSESK